MQHNAINTRNREASNTTSAIKSCSHPKGVDQWFSTFLIRLNPNETRQKSNEPSRNNSIVLCKEPKNII